MKVGELISMLQCYNPEMTVVVEGRGEMCEPGFNDIKDLSIMRLEVGCDNLIELCGKYIDYGSNEGDLYLAMERDKGEE